MNFCLAPNWSEDILVSTDAAFYLFELYILQFASLSGMLSSMLKKKIFPGLYTEEQAILNLEPIEY